MGKTFRISGERVNTMQEEFSRTQMLLGEAALLKLSQSKVAVFGVGGVGGFAAQALARSGVGKIELVDSDTVALSNINRQIVAFHSTLGKFKTEVMKNMIEDINPLAEVTEKRIFFLPETADSFDFSSYDYVIDAVDTVTAKIQLAEKCAEAGVPLISSMGAGNKLDPTAFEVTDIYKTSVCPLAKVMRRELKKRGIKKLKVVYSKEPPLTPESPSEPEKSASSRRQTPGSVAFVPSVAGLVIAGEVIKDLISE